MAAAKDRMLVVPLIRDQGSSLSAEQIGAVQSAWSQAMAIESYLFGFGTRRSLDELFRLQPAQHLVEVFKTPYVCVNARRFLRFLKQLLFTTSPQVLASAHITMPQVRLVAGEAEPRTLSSRSVLEAYAITIEVIAEYIKSMLTSAMRYRQAPKRSPSPVYSVAIETMLSTICGDRNISMEQYIRGEAGSDVYWAVSLTSYAAMQVPVMEDPLGDTLVMGSLKQLNPAFRLMHILENIRKERIPSPLSTYEERSENILVHTWLAESHQSIGDPWSYKFYEHIDRFVTASPEVFGSSSMSAHHNSWAARAALFRQPYQMIGDGGVWVDQSFRIRFIRTADNCIVSFADPHGESNEAWASYVGASSLHILEALVFGSSWYAAWDKVCTLDADSKMSAMILAMGFYLNQAGMPIEDLPRIQIASGYR